MKFYDLLLHEMLSEEIYQCNFFEQLLHEMFIEEFY